MKKFFRRIILKISYWILNGRFGNKLTEKLNLEVKIFSRGKVVFSKILDRNDLVKIFKHEIEGSI
jgi:hypothetical protein